MAKQYWLAKSEPASYSWADFMKDGKSAWTGVRNYQARNNLRAMKKGDLVAFYHSVTGKEIVGIAKVVTEAYADKTADEGDWSAVDFEPAKALKKPVSLEQIKADPLLSKMTMMRQTRMSVTPVTEAEYQRILELGGA
jgi:predicted RNA-binding protein with PUA-like domain